jgi:hypothetical protein
MERRDTVNRNSGMVVSRRYTYPTGYQFQGLEPEQRPARTDFRIAWIETEIAKNRELRRSNHPSTKDRQTA